MRLFRSLASLAALLILSGLAQTSLAQNSPSDAEIQAALNRTLELYLEPKAQAFAEAARDFADRIAEVHCGSEQPADASLEQDFAQLIRAYVPVSIWQAGPMNQQEGPLRFQLWPDGRGFAKRAVDRALASENAALRDWQAVREQGIALLGLTALEYLVTEIAEIEVAENDAGKSARSDSYACALLIALSENFAVMAQEYAAQWQPDATYRIAFETAIDGNVLYPDTQALLREALAGLRATSQHLGEKKLLRPLGTAPGEARPIRAEFRRLDLSTVSIAAQFAALAELLTLPGGLGLLSDQAAGGSNSLALSRASNGWAAALADLSMQGIASEDAAAAQELRELAGFAAVYVHYFAVDMPNAFGITAGFSAADGD
jgi:predicted lipoprotein